MPADEQLSLLLHELGVIDEAVEHEILATWLASAVKADDSHAAIAALQAAVDAAWADGTMTKLARKRRPPKPPAAVVVVAESEEVLAIVAPEPVQKAATKKPAVTKKTVVKKAVTKKPAVKKAATKKPTAKKSGAKKVAKKTAKRNTSRPVPVSRKRVG